jgi:hypothetical protein
MTDRKKPGGSFWATVVLVVPLLYVASFGPACWMTARKLGAEDRKAHPVMTAYFPLGYIGQHGPRALRDAIFRYAWIGVGRDKYILLVSNPDGSQYLPPRKP